MYKMYFSMYDSTSKNQLEMFSIFKLMSVKYLQYNLHRSTVDDLNYCSSTRIEILHSIFFYWRLSISYFNPAQVPAKGPFDL